MFTPLDEERQEKAFLERIHGSDHRIPGVMTISSSSSKVVGAASSNGRVKTRLIMTATRHPLRACGSIYNFLKAIYDILEVHHFLCKKRHVLHRDISTRNIHWKPYFSEDPRDKRPLYDDSDRPELINEVLGRKGSDGEVDRSECAMLGDFDNAAEYIHETRHQNPGVNGTRTGTGMFMSRVVSSGCYLHGLIAAPGPYEMLQFKDPLAADAYFQLHPDRRDFDQLDNLVGIVLRDIPCTHQPRHDAESIFWVLVEFLLRSIPPGEVVEEPRTREAFKKTYSFLAEHTVGSVPDNRGLLFVDGEAPNWRSVLHPALDGIANMIAALTEVARPEYHWYSKPPPEDHLHEAMQRIIFDQIYKMDKVRDHIPISPMLRHYEPPKRPTVRVDTWESLNMLRRPKIERQDLKRKREGSNQDSQVPL